MEKQIKISKWLKGLVIVLGIMGIIFFGGLTWFILGSGKWFIQDEHHLLVIFSWFEAILCYGVLYQFWKVCNEIGKDNSFSLENAQAFHNMAIIGVIMACGYAGRIVYDIVARMPAHIAVVFAVAMILISLAFTVVCEALSQLIKNAYEMKLENDLTI